MRKQIAHIDLDCFFVSVERIKNPALAGKPVIVGGRASGRGVVASASYEARKYGVHSAMATSRALRLCPGLIVISGHHAEYSTLSESLFKRLAEFSPVVERASIDEMYLDFTGCESLYGNDLPGFIGKLQQIVKKEFNLPSTIALASNKLVAKIAANTVKPEGVIYVPHGTEEKFLAPLPVGVIPGVGKVTEKFLTERGFKIVADLQSVSLEKCLELFGAHGEWIHNASHGRGSTTFKTEHIQKSISRERTFEHDISEIEELENILFTLVENVCSTLRSESLKACTVQLKIRTSDFTTTTHRQTVEPTNYDPEIYGIARQLLKNSHNPKISLRLIGVGLMNLVMDSQNDLFPLSEKREKVLKVIDRLREKFGDNTIKIGSNY